MSEAKKRALGETNYSEYVGDMNQMNSDLATSLPETVTRYIEASNGFDANAAAACFAPDAVLRDQDQDYIGIKAIETLISESSEKYQPHATVTRAQKDGEKVMLTAKVAGQFPGSPVELKFDFLLRQGKIAKLTIQ